VTHFSGEDPAYGERVDDTVRVRSVRVSTGVPEIDLTTRVRNAGTGAMHGAGGVHYSLGGNNGSVGRVGQTFSNDTADPFCEFPGSLATVTQRLMDHAGARFAMGAGRYWERDGSLAFQLSHDPFLAHEAYTWAYANDLGVPGGSGSSPSRYLTPGSFYAYVPPSNAMAVCLADILNLGLCAPIQGYVFIP
jgi:hypothetical protein